jgi:hypothetical protein
MSGHAIGGDHYAKDNHQTCYCEPDQAQAAMQVHPPSSDQRSLRDQQNDPRGENRPVDVNENVRQRSLEHTGKVVAAGKTNEDCGKNDDSHAGEKEIVVPESTTLKFGLECAGRHSLLKRGAWPSSCANEKVLYSGSVLLSLPGETASLTRKYAY